MTWCCRPLQEYEHRFAVWLDNLEYIVKYNAEHASHWVSLHPPNLVAAQLALLSHLLSWLRVALD